MLAAAGYAERIAEMQYRRDQMLYADLVVERPVEVRVRPGRTFPPAIDVRTEEAHL